MMLNFHKLHTQHGVSNKVIQIGANIGEEVDLFTEDSHFIEPNPISFDILKTKVKNAHKLAMGSKHEFRKYYKANNSDMCNTFYPEMGQKQGINYTYSHEVMAFTLSLFLELNPTALECPTLIIDAEGSELDILRGIKSRHIKQFKHIIAEWNNCYQNSYDELIASMEIRGYKVITTSHIDNYYGDILFEQI